MKHKWKITPHGKKTNYYTCEICGLRLKATSTEKANETEWSCYER